MEKQTLKIENIETVTHNVLRFTLENPNKLEFQPGQAALVAIDKDGWRDKGHPFTFTSLPNDNHLEFTIKIYPDHEGVTNELSKLSPRDHLILERVFGAIHYKGKGVFIAGGAGVTPFISILRDAHLNNESDKNKLIFSNKEEKDIILQNEFENILGNNFHNILSQENNENYAYGYIDKDYLKDKIDLQNDYVYLCGPSPMMKAVEKELEKLNVPKENIIKEDFSKM